MAETDDFEAQLLAQMREDFLTESQEILDRLEPLLAQLEQGGSLDLLGTAFRDVHTLKGTAGFVGLTDIQRLAHKLEDVLGALRDGQLVVTPELMDPVFAGVRLLAHMREDVSGGGTGEADIAPSIELLDAVLRAPMAGTSQLEGGVEAEAAASVPSLPVRSTEDVVGVAGPVAPGVPMPARTESTLRVDVNVLDAVMELVGELITTRNALLTTAERIRDEPLNDQVAVLDRLTRELQTAITNVRLVPVERLFARFSGVVRNLAREREKQVRLVVKGGETPFDRTISERIYDPLIHLLRNAVDHGLESAAERVQVGKPEEGTICLAAERRGDTVILRVSDDGRGIDPDRVRQVAVRRGVCSAEEAAALSDEQAVHLVLSPGFSTTTEVTDLSGRGVGLDVVVRNVHRLRGSVSIETELGQGTTFVIQLPLALAILQVQLVRVNGFIYAVPMHVVREALRIAGDAVQATPQGEIALVRGVALPVCRLRNWLPRKAATFQRGALAADGPEPAIVVRRLGRDEVLVVDELVGKQHVVVKPLGSYLGAVQGVEGAAILPDGSVTLVLDVEALLG